MDQWKIDNNGQRMKRENFASTLKKAIDSRKTLNNIIKSGLRTCGFSPFNADAVDYNVFNKKVKGERVNLQTEENFNEISSNKEEMEAEKHLQFFEKTLQPDVLSTFREAFKSGTKVTSTYKGLFDYWLGLQQHSGYYLNSVTIP